MKKIIKSIFLKIKIHYFILSLIMLFSSCKKEEFVNRISGISVESSRLIATEGESIIANVILTDELSEDLPIQLGVEIADIKSYINPDDFNPIFEYSNDLGKTWKKSSNNKVIFESQNINLKIKIKTNDDDKLEFNEEFDLVLNPKPDGELTILGTIDNIRVSVEDNEKSEWEDEIDGALFEVDEDYNFKLVGLNRNSYLDSRFKEMIDNGLDPKLLTDLSNVTQSGEIPITYFEAIYENSGLGGFVFNTGYDGQDEWVMGLNIYWAYYGSDRYGNFGPIEYNEDGMFGFVLTHEYGHILTLNQKYEIDQSVDMYNDEPCEEFSEYSDCFKNDSAINLFHEAFYESDIDYPEPHFVTDYAETNVGEDIAESFSFHVTQKDIPEIEEESSGALHKMHFIGTQPRLSASGDKIRNVLSNVKETGVGSENEPISFFNHTIDGVRIPCTDRAAIQKASRENKFKR